MQTSQIDVMSRYLTLIAPSRNAIPRERTYSSTSESGIRSQVQLGSTPLMRAKMTITTRLISILITAVRVADTTTIYLGKEILRIRSPRTIMA